VKTLTAEEIAEVITGNYLSDKTDDIHMQKIQPLGAKSMSTSIIACQFCGQQFKSKGIARHVKDCVFNPKAAPLTNICPKCGSDVDVRALVGHIPGCDGDGPAFIKRREMRIKARTAKLIRKSSLKQAAKKVNIPVQKKEIIEEKELMGKGKQVGSIIQKMENHLGDTPVSLKEFQDWKQATEALWAKVK
jgi:hypothetical protein